MATLIKTRTFSAVQDQRVELSNSQFARPFNIPTWTTLRIALRLNMTNTGANLAGFPAFYVGICSGSTNKILDGTTTNWCGVKSNSSGSPSGGVWTYYNSGGLVEYYGFAMRPTKRVGSTTTDNSASVISGITSAIPADATLEKRAFLFLDITKGSPLYTFTARLYFSSSSPAVTDATAADFITQSEAAVPAFAGHSVGSSQTLAVDEAAGVFNHINIAWDQTTPKIEISDHKVFQVA